MSQVDQYIGARLRRRRLEFYFSLGQFSDALGCTESELEAIEAGKARLGPRLMVQCCGLLDVMPDYFFEGFDGVRTPEDIITGSNVVDLVAHRKRRCTG